MTFTLPANVAPASPVTYEWLQALMESQAQANAQTALEATLAQVFPATGLTAAVAISNSGTNTALVASPAITGPAAGSVWQLEAWGIYSSPGSGPATMSWIAYSGGSAGTALATIPAITPSVSQANDLWRAVAVVDFYSATKAQAELTVQLGTSASTDAASAYVASPTATAGVTITDGSTLTLNFVFGSAVSGSALTALGGYARQIA